MKLASLRMGGRDGTLVVVDTTMTRAVAVPHIAPTLAQALENWAEAERPLRGVDEQLREGPHPEEFSLDVNALASPLPRSHQFLDGSVYLHHMERARSARGAAMPPNHTTSPVMYQGLSDRFCGPTEDMLFPTADLDIDFEPEIAVVLDDVPMGVSADEASSHIKLAMLLNDYTLRALTRTELPKGFGFLQAKPTSSFSPVAVTLDELGDGWDGSKFHCIVRSTVNGHEIGVADAAQGMFFDYPQLIEHAALTRDLSAGTILGAGSISNADGSGASCIAEARVNEELQHGAPRTPFLQHGDRIRLEAVNRAGSSLFGAIDQQVTTLR